MSRELFFEWSQTKQNKNSKHPRTWSTSSFPTAEGGVFLKFGKDVPEETAAFQKQKKIDSLNKNRIIRGKIHYPSMTSRSPGL